MSYDIPPPLQHKEKILFGLTFPQLAYALPAFLLIFIVVFKSGLDIAVSGAISLILAGIAAWFMFFNGKYILTGLIDHIRNKEANVDSNEMRNIIDIQEIKDNSIKTSKTELAILEIIPINFMIKTEKEQESIITGFQKFLNSLNHPLQIHISSDKVSVREHLTLLAKKANQTELFEAYCAFIKETIKSNNVQNRKFHIIIPKTTDLNIQAKVCQEMLQSIGLKTRRLDEIQLLTFLNKYLGGNHGSNLKQGEVKSSTQSLIAPENIQFQPETINSQHTALAVQGYPHSVETGFLDKIISSGEDYDISIHIEPHSIETTMVQLNRELQKQNSDLYTDSKKGILNPSLEIKFKSTRKVLEELQKGQQKLFNVSLYILCNGELLAKKVTASLNSIMIEAKKPSYRMKQAYESMLPLAKDTLNIKRNIHTKGLSAFFPFSSPFLDIDADGTLLGLNKNKIPYIKDIFRLSNANGVVLATSGSGKSYFTKLLLSRQYMNGTAVLIIDPQGEYLGITNHYNGEIITISKDSATMINPLDLMGHEYLEKRLSLMDMFHIMFGDINELQKSILDKAIDLTYERKGITRDDWESAKPPTMSDLHKVLSELMKSSSRQEAVTYRALVNRIHMYTAKGAFGFLDKQTNIDFKSDFVCFNICHLPKQVKPVIMYLVLDYVYMKMKESLKRKLLVIDEAWSMLQTAEESSYIFEIVKTCRKYNMGLLMITQDVADLVNSKAGNAVLANSSYTFLLRQKPAVISNVARTFYLSQREKDFLVTCQRGSGILLLENDHQELEVIASSMEHDLITTNPDELIKLSKPTKDESKEVIDIGLDIQKVVHPEAGLSLVEKNFLVNQGYKRGKFCNLKGKTRIYFVRERSPESLQHTFLVCMVEEAIKEYTGDVWLYQTSKPDIVFKNWKEQRIAVEIETGKGRNRKKDLEKFEALAKEWSNRAFILLSCKDLRDRYSGFGQPILLRKDVAAFLRRQFNA